MLKFLPLDSVEITEQWILEFEIYLWHWRYRKAVLSYSTQITCFQAIQLLEYKLRFLNEGGSDGKP